MLNTMWKWLIIVLSVFLVNIGKSIAQSSISAKITGTVTDGLTDVPVEFVTVYLKGSSNAVETDASGRYNINVPAQKAFVLIFTRIGYKESVVNADAMPNGSSRQFDITLAPTTSDIEIEIRSSRIQEAGMVREGVEQLRLLPSTSGNLESLLPHLALGASSGTGGELSSQYNVRGGNYDENLVYVNDFEIYRPQLIRAGQQEGLSFPNIDLVRDLSFSSGGFEARYGDKQSSVLDIKYKRPEAFGGSFSGSFLGATAHLEGSLPAGKSDFKKWRYLVGTRYKTNKYLLGSLDVKGEYVPNFTDLQVYLTYDLSKSLQVGFLGNYNNSSYEFRPTTRSTAFGLINYALQLYSVFEGEEKNVFTTGMGGVSLTWLPENRKNPLFMKWLFSGFGSYEKEAFDILGSYSLRQIESDIGSSRFGEVLEELGSGTQHQYVRNLLQTRVANIEYKGGLEIQMTEDGSTNNFLQWSLKYQFESIYDRINEWERIDSAGYSLPYSADELQLSQVLKTENELNSSRLSGYFQDTYTYRKAGKRELRLSMGLRANYWTINKEFLFSPRVQLLYKPLGIKSDISWKLAFGYYMQPPFYRELRRPDGLMNLDLLAQKSFHYLAGFSYDFYLGKDNPTKFKLIAEGYYKNLWDLVSYEVENVRIRYAGENNASGYVTGLDVRLNGEFVNGAESWINLSFLRARERLNGVEHLEREVGKTEATVVKDVPRPSDQLVTLALFFQDYLPKNDNFRVHLNFTLGTGLPYGLQGNNTVYRNTYRLNPYHRVDIGFSFLLYDREKKSLIKPDHWLRFSKKTWISLEVFNLLQVQNQAGNTWIKTVFLQQYAIPNYLTSRRLNLRFRCEF
ncbi:MAG: TonB-dependent receptor [Saprospiraceae bacterium]